MADYRLIPLERGEIRQIPRRQREQVYKDIYEHLLQGKPFRIDGLVNQPLGAILNAAETALAQLVDGVRQDIR